jgi:hypothetical protein
MDISDDDLDTAFAMYEEFGPDRLVDRRERLTTELRIPSAEDIERIMEYMEKISKTVWKLAEKGGEIKLGKEKVREELQAEHPFLKSKGLTKAVFLVNYFAWHEGYDK